MTRVIEVTRTDQQESTTRMNSLGHHPASFSEVEGLEPETPTPRPAMVPAATMAEPETAAAVYNTMEIENMGRIIVQYPHRQWYEQARQRGGLVLDYEAHTRLSDITRCPITPEDVRQEARALYARLRKEARSGVNVAAVK